MHLLVTGFEAFGRFRHNPSEALLTRLPAAVGGFEVRTRTLPVDTRRIGAALAPLWAQAPAAVLHLGLAHERTRLSLERVALNLLDFELADNAGLRVEDQPVEPGGPLARPSRLPLRAILAAWREASVPGELSTSAGTFLCNQSLYLSLAALPERCPVGFIHLPPDETLAAEDGRDFVPLGAQAAAVERALEVVAAQIRT